MIGEDVCLDKQIAVLRRYKLTEKQLQDFDEHVLILANEVSLAT